MGRKRGNQSFLQASLRPADAIGARCFGHVARLVFWVAVPLRALGFPVDGSVCARGGFSTSGLEVCPSFVLCVWLGMGLALARESY